MNAKELMNDLKERVADVGATENAPGVGYYGSEMKEAEVAEAGENMKNRPEHESVPDSDPRITNTTDR